MKKEFKFCPSSVEVKDNRLLIEGYVGDTSIPEFYNLVFSDPRSWTVTYNDDRCEKDAERYRKEAEVLLDKKDNYSELKRVLEMAYSQAAEGKGKERHANGEKFEDQPIMTIAKGHGLGYQTGQAAKKLQEAHTLLKLRGKHAAIQEILGAINYAAAAVLLIEQMEDKGEKK